MKEARIRSTPLSRTWYGNFVLPALEELQRLALGADREACEKLCPMLLALVEDLREIGHSLPEKPTG